MVNINDIYEFVNFELTKNQSGNTLNQDEFNRCCAWANLEYFKTQMGLPEQYQVGQPVAPISYEVTQLITDRMRVFKQFKGGRDLPVLSVDIDGQALYPEDYVHYSSIRYKGRDVTPVRDAEVGSALQSSIIAPSEQYPIVVFYDTYLQFYPLKSTFVDFTYLRLPVTPFWSVSVGADDSYIYLPNSSIQFEWPQECLTDISNLILKYASINLKSQLNIQMAQNREDSGK